MDATPPPSASIILVFQACKIRLDVHFWAFFSQKSLLITSGPALNPGESWAELLSGKTLNPEKQTLNPGTETIPGTQTLNPGTQTLTPGTQTLNPWNSNPKPQTLSQKP